MNYAVVSCSLNPKSKSRIMCRAAYEELRAAGVDPQWIDLAEFDLPHCDGGRAYGRDDVIKLKEELLKFDGYVIGTPVYNYYASSAAKNMIELTGRDVWTEKVVAFVCAAGGAGSYMSIMSLAGSLMLDFRTVIVPRFVYATGQHFHGDGIADGDIIRRVEEVADQLVRFTTALRG